MNDYTVVHLKPGEHDVIVMDDHAMDVENHTEEAIKVVVGRDGEQWAVDIKSIG